jgi:hypothetical protein
MKRRELGIGKRTYEIWEAEGRSEGRRLEYGSGVEREIAMREGLSDEQ